MKKIGKPGPRRKERGLALVSVLWALSILSLIAASMLTSSVLSYRMERNDWARVKADALAEAAINRAILALTDARPEMRSRVDGVAQDIAFGTVRVRVRVQDEYGKIDLNAASTDMLKRLFTSAGLPFADADALAERVADWRKPRAAEGESGPKETDNLIAGPGYRPRSGPFQSVDELRLVAGVTPQLFARVEPALTVYSKKGNIDQDVAPKEALMALPDMDARKADEMITARLNAPTGGMTDALPGTLDMAAPPNGRVFSISVEVQGRRVVQQAVIALTGDPARPYLVLAWK